jgi:serine/threonine-protein kinase
LGVLIQGKTQNEFWEQGMPDLSQALIVDLTQRLEKFLATKAGYGRPIFINAGGSAAVFKVQAPQGYRAFKVFDPKFINDEIGSKERHRLTLQERLINHACEFLVQTYSIETAEETAFIEMEFVEWPQLKNCLAEVPDEKVTQLIDQLVQAVQYLEALNIVHRDIKPENIHVSPDWTKLTLLDLGVVREFDPGPEAGETDQGGLRPFLATAQYSSPEYLFRLDEPSPDLWRALNFYQVGAVLHDLVMKEAIFQSEINTGNRWLVAKAVLTKEATFVDGTPERMAAHKSLARRCLEKDMSTRLQLVEWNDFTTLGSGRTLNSLRERLHANRAKGETKIARQLNFERGEFIEALTSKVRDRLVAVCQTDLPIKLHPLEAEGHQSSLFIFKSEESLHIAIKLDFHWKAGMHLRSVEIKQSASIFPSESRIDFTGLSQTLTCVFSIDSPFDGSALDLANMIAASLESALDLIDIAGSDPEQWNDIYRKDLMAARQNWSAMNEQ